jgi:excisionase family DNA binding protein
MIEQDRKNQSPAGEKGERASSAVPPFTKRYYRVDEVAAYFAVSERTIYRMIYAGEIKTIRIRDRIRISVKEVQAFEERAIATENDD